MLGALALLTCLLFYGPLLVFLLHLLASGAIHLLLFSYLPGFSNSDGFFPFADCRIS